MQELTPTARQRSGPITRITINDTPLIKMRGKRIVLNMRTGQFEPEDPPIPVVPAPASSRAVQVTPKSSNQSEPKKRKRKARAQDQPLPLDQLKFLTVRQASLLYPAYSQKAFRHLIAQAEAYARYPKAGLRSNGFINCIFRPGNGEKILLDSERIGAWITAGAVAIQPRPESSNKESK